MSKVAGVLLSLTFLLAACSSSEPPAKDKFGRVWHETEGPWTGTWTRRGDSNTFDAEWKGAGGQTVKDELTLEPGSSNQVVLFRKGTNGRYRGQLSSDGTKVESGTADWFKGNWSATIDK
jgi:hypothetical protein